MSVSDVIECTLDLYGCSTVVLIGFTCPAITVVTVILRVLLGSVRGHLAASLDRPNPRPPHYYRGQQTEVGTGRGDIAAGNYRVRPSAGIEIGPSNKERGAIKKKRRRTEVRRRARGPLLRVFVKRGQVYVFLDLMVFGTTQPPHECSRGRPRRGSTHLFSFFLIPEPSDLNSGRRRVL